MCVVSCFWWCRTNPLIGWLRAGSDCLTASTGGHGSSHASTCRAIHQPFASLLQNSLHPLALRHACDQHDGMARHSLVELDNASDGYYRPPRRRRKHRSHRHEDDPSLASYVDPPGSPDLDELRRARTSYYERSPESRRRRTEEGRRVEPEAHYSRRSDGSFDRQDTASRRHRRRYTEDDMRRRHRRRDEDGDASVVYVYQDDHPRGDDRGGHRDRYGPPRRDLKTDKARVIRSARTGELIQERIPRRADRSPKDGRYEESMAQLERGGTVSHRPLTRTTSVREPERTRTVRSPVKRSATTARPRPGSVVGSVRHARASSASMAGNRPSIFSIFVPPAPHRPRIEKM